MLIYAGTCYRDRGSRLGCFRERSVAAAPSASAPSVQLFACFSSTSQQGTEQLLALLHAA